MPSKAERQPDFRLRTVNSRFERWMYPGGSPNRLARLLNRGWAVAGAVGLWPSRLATLEVAGRRTGRMISVPLVMTELDGERYVVSMLGEDTNWVLNVRAAGGRAVLRQGHRRAVHLVEVDPSARAQILRRYLSLAPGARAFIPVDAPIEELTRIAAHIPVFHLTADPIMSAGGHPKTAV